MNDKNIMVVGDLHGRWKELNDIISKKNPNLILQVGDFGFWPHFHGKAGIIGKEVWDQYGIDNPNTTILFCDGNHEDHHSLNAMKTNKIMNNVYYMSRGSTYQLDDGRIVLFMGGANSIDKNQRTIGVDWFPEELISQRNIMDLSTDRIDIVISHTCPEEFKIDGIYGDNDSSRKALQYILETYHPSLWYFGHFHMHLTGYTNSCRWFGLNELGRIGGWQWLE